MIKSAKILVDNALEKFEESANNNGITGIQTGFKKLDVLTNGWQAGDFIIIAARPGMGKSQFLFSMIKNIAIHNGDAVAFFSLEYSSHRIITKMISSETGITIQRLEKGMLDPQEWERINLKINNLYKSPIYIEDDLLSFSDFKEKASMLVANYDVKLIVFDCIQYYRFSDLLSRSREEAILEITQNLRNLAKELQVPIITTSEISRQVECREDSNRPILSDLRESELIEPLADIVCLIYRPEYYGISEWEDGSSSEGQAELILAKHRNGGLDNIRLKFTGYLGEFSDLE